MAGNFKQWRILELYSDDRFITNCTKGLRKYLKVKFKYVSNSTMKKIPVL